MNRLLHSKDRAAELAKLMAVVIARVAVVSKGMNCGQGVPLSTIKSHLFLSTTKAVTPVHSKDVDGAIDVG